jgi:hypothetical protein
MCSLFILSRLVFLTVFIGWSSAEILKAECPNPSKPISMVDTLQFDSQGSDIILGNTNDLSLRQHSFSFLTWVYVDAFNRENSILACKESEFHRENQCLVLLFRDAKPYFAFYHRDLPGYVSIPPKTWVHLGFIYDMKTSTQRLYVNGQLKGEAAERPPFEGLHSVYLSRYVDGRGLNGR